MRWDQLFTDLEAQADALAAQQRAGEVGELVRAELARLALVDRLRAAIGTVLSVGCLGGARISGVAARVGPDWLLLDDRDGREIVLALASVSSVSGLGRATTPAGSAGPVGARLGLRSVLRGIGRDRSLVSLQLVDGSRLDGTIDRVGADFLELATHPGGEFRRRGEVRDVPAVPLTAIALVRRQAAG